MSRLQALREQKQTQAAAILALRDKLNADGYTPTAEDNGNWDRANADYNATLAAVAREEVCENVARDAAARNSDRPAPFLPNDGRERGAPSGASVDELRALAFAGWANQQCGKFVTDEQAQACRALRLNPNSKELAIGLYATEDYNRLQSVFRSSHPSKALDRAREFKATLSSGSGTSGGYLIAPEQMRSSLEINMLAYGGVRQVAETIRTATGELMSWPTADDTTNTGVQLGESGSIGSSVDPSFGKVLWSAYKFSSKPVLAPFELMQDSVFNLPSVIGSMLGERLGRITNTKFTTGTGAATPKGIVTAATTFSAASATAIAFDDVLGLIHSVDPAYRNGASFMLHDSITLALRKLKDGNGQYLWQPGMSMGVPDALAGYSMTNNQDMDSTMSSGKKTLLFGQMPKYKVRTVGEVRMYHLVERYRDNDQDAFVAFTREDGNLLDAGTAPVKVLTH